MQFLADFVHQGLGSKGGVGSAGSAVGGGGRLVDDHVIAVDVDVGDVIASEDAHAPRTNGRAGEGPGLVGQVGLAGGQPAGGVGGHLDADVARRGRAGAFEDLGPVHGQLYGPACLARQDDGDRLEVDADLAAETAADLHRHHLDAVQRNLQQLGHLAADGERSLGAAPDGHVTIGVPQRGGVVRLNVTLMDRRRVELALDDDRCVRQTPCPRRRA